MRPEIRAVIPVTLFTRQQDESLAWDDCLQTGEGRCSRSESGLRSSFGFRESGFGIQAPRFPGPNFCVSELFYH